MALLTKTSRVGALAIAAIGFEAVKAANTYDTEMLKIRTDAGASTAELNFMRGAVLDLAKSGKSMGQGPTSLAQGLYHLESLGIRGKDALHALELASQASAISGANLEETTSALGAALFVGIKGAGGMDHVMQLLNATVGQGNMRMGELVHALGTGVLPAAKVAGLGITDVMAALAVFSDSGQNASSAAAQFATALHFITNPTTKAQDALSSLGMSQNRLARDLRKPNGMVTALRDLRDHLDKLPGGRQGIAAGHVLGAIFPGGRGRVLQTELVMLDRAQTKWTNINKQATPERWREAVAMQRDNPATQLATAFSKLEGHLVDFGHKIRPLVMPVLVAVLSIATALLSLFAKFPELPVIAFVGLLTLGFLALGRAIGGSVVALGRYALGLPVATAETTALAAADTGLAASAEAATIAEGGMLAAALPIIAPIAAVAAALYLVRHRIEGVAGLSPAVEHARLKAGHLHAIKTTGHDAGMTTSRNQLAFYAKYPSALEDDLAGGMQMDQATRNTLNRYFAAHHIAPPKLLGPVAEGPGVGRLRDIVLKVDGREIARATRKEIREAQARG
jgi:TP901 family phage tail tape measure protein